MTTQATKRLTQPAQPFSTKRATPLLCEKSPEARQAWKDAMYVEIQRNLLRSDVEAQIEDLDLMFDAITK